MAETRAGHSIKRRLLVVLLLTTLLAWVATLLFSYRDTLHELDELIDAHLAQSTSLLIAQIGHEAEGIDTEHAPPLHRYSRKVAFQVWEKGNQLVLHSPSAPNVPLSSRSEGFSDSVIAGKKWRVFSAWDESRHFLVQVGERREVRDDLAETIAENLLRAAGHTAGARDPHLVRRRRQPAAAQNTEQPGCGTPSGKSRAPGSRRGPGRGITAGAGAQPSVCTGA
jgi:two-component system sensor histidine kinase QseC